jgi:hypothetical protein
MFEQSIDQVLEKDIFTRKIYLGSFARDELPKKINYPACLIINTHPRSKEGEHWLALYYSKTGYCTFFDSFANPPSYFNLQEYIDKTSNEWTFNKKRVQGASNLCGYYCILYLLYKARDKTLNFFNEFSSTFTNNDIKILKTIKEFNI